uniref:SH2 domain-containing adapter protein F-like isoform X2 n=1 Tax=Petromyzon marinus TaxID=7757 RepID=A0AAJ7WTV5_PETMA|nr:SH2 domain-containing adapter protein F-like isoform X2 [Petromyzon marinus]
MSRWIREHLGGLGFGGARRPPPPEPPQPDYSAEPELPCSYKAVGRASRGRERRRLSTLKGRAEAEDLDVTESRQHGCLGEGSSRRSGQQRSRSERPPRLTESFHRKCWLLDGSEMREESGVVLVEPDLERVYRAQRDRDFADPYTTTDQSDGLRESGAARPGEGETKEAVRPSLPPQPPPGLTSASPKHRLIRVAGKVASSEEREDPAEGPAPPTPPCPPIQSDISCRKVPILPPSTADVEAKEEGSVRPLPLHHLYDTPYEPPCARGLPQPESPAGNERVEAPPGDPGRLAETAPPDPDCDPPASSSPTQALALLPSHPSTPHAPPAPSSVPSEPSSQPPARDSRMPKDDDRPPEEYDQPWEWKRDCISQAFAADVSCTDELPWPPPVGQLDGEAGPSIMPGGPESSGDGRDSLRSSLAHGDTDAEPVGMAAEEPQGNRAGTDTADRAMGQQLWFHGDIGRVEAEQILQQHRTSSFLVRPSESDPRELSLSLRSAAGFVHMRVSWDQGGHVVLGGNSPPFASVPEAVLFYRGRHLPVRGAEQLSLLHPVPPPSSSSAMSLAQPAPRRPLSDDGLSLS